MSFDSVYLSADGVHGPGPALELRDGPSQALPALDAIDFLQNALNVNPNIYLLDLRLRLYDGKKQYQVRPGRERTYLPIHPSKGLLPDAFQETDQKAVNALVAILKCLTQEEIRALGTHQSAQQTIRAIEYNVFIHLFNRLLAELDSIERPGQTRHLRRGRVKSDLPSLEGVIDEIGRKSHGNKLAYGTAWKRLSTVASSGDEIVAIAANAVFSDPDSIWIDDVTKWKKIGERMADLHAYVRALRNACFPPAVAADPEKNRRAVERVYQEDLEGREGQRRAEAYFKVRLPTFPTEPSAAFPWIELRHSLVAIFDSLPGVTPYHEQYLTGKRRRIAAGL